MLTSDEIFNAQLAGASEANDVPERVLRRLLELEMQHQNLHGWGARPALRRDIAIVMEEEMPQENRD